MLPKIKAFLFENITVRQTVAKNTFWLAFGNIASRLIRAVVIVLAARFLGAAGYGIFSYALSLAAFFTLFSDIGISGLLTREVVKNPELRDQYLSTSFFVKLTLLLLTVTITIFVAPHFTKIEAAKPLIPVIAFLLAFDSLQNFGYALVRAGNRMEIEAGLSIATNLYIVLLGVIALFLRPTAKALTVAYIGGSGLGLITMIWLLRTDFRKVFFYFKKPLVLTILLSAWPFALMGILNGLMINTDAIMIGWYRTAEELGFYSAAQRPIQLFNIIPAIIAASLFPIMAALVKNQDETRLKAIMSKTLAAAIALALPLVVGGMILGHPLIEMVFGDAYTPSVLSFQILLMTTLLVFPTGIIDNLIFAYDRQKIFIIAASAGGLGNVFFNFLLIPRYGIAGASVATILAQLLSSGYIWRQAKKVRGFSVPADLKKVALATIVMGAATTLLYVTHTHVMVTLLVSVVVYVISLYFLKEPLLRELKITLKSGASVLPQA